MLLIRQFCLPNHTKLPLPAKMHFDFRPLLRKTFAEFSQQYPYIRRLQPSAGGSRGKANARGLGVWLSQSLTFGSLAAACGACFLRLQKATLGSSSGRSKDVLQDHGIWVWRSITFGSSAATYMKGKVNVQYPSPPGRQEMVA